MATLNISLPESLKGYAKDQAETANYSNPSDYVRSLIREDKERNESRQRIEAMLLEGVHSGDAIPVTSEYWAKKKKRLARALLSKKS